MTIDSERPSGSSRSATEGGHRRRRRRGIAWILGTLAVLVLAVGAVAVAYLTSLADSFDNQTDTFASAFPEESSRPEKPSARTSQAEPMNILLLGSDSGGGSGEHEDLPQVPQSGRSDTMMWVHLPGDRQKVYVMSVMRDLWVEIPGEGEHKLNAAYSFGGVPKAVQTLESLFGTRIDHVAAVDLAGFQGIVDALGGVTINNPRAFTSHGAHHFAAGSQTMDGDRALAFVRERYAFPDGDYSRVRNQQLFLGAVATQILNSRTLTNPALVAGIVDQLSPHLTVDDTLDSAELVTIGGTLTGIRSDDLEMFTVPTEGVGQARSQSVVWPDEAAIAELGLALSRDELAAHLDGQ